MSARSTRGGMLSLLAGILLFSTIEVAAKLMQSGGSIAGSYPFWLASLRFVFAGALLLVPSLHCLRGRSFGARDAGVLVGLGLLGVTLMSSLYHVAITFLPANIAALVFSCNPVFVVLFAAVLLAEKITCRKLLAFAVCVGGIALLALDNADGLSAPGLMLMVGATLVFALYTVLFKKVTPRYGALPVTCFVSLIGGLFIVPVAFFQEGFPLAAYALADWLGIAYLVVVGTALAYYLFIYGMGHVEAGVGSMVFFLKPFLAALFAWWILGEVLSIREMAAGTLILAGMVVALAPARR